MSYKRKGQLARSPEWAKHLRKYLKRQFWKRERTAEKEILRQEAERPETKT